MIEIQHKITRFRDIPQFTRTGGCQINVPWRYLEEQLARLDRPGGILVLDPDFQRHHVWNEEKQCRYVEYILRGGKSSRQLHLNCASWYSGPKEEKIELVDGKQRLEAVRRFLRSEIKAFGSYYKEFTDTRCMTGPDFVFCMNDLKTRAEVLQWYIDLNAGGVVHSEEEIQRVRDLLKQETQENGDPVEESQKDIDECYPPDSSDPDLVNVRDRDQLSDILLAVRYARICESESI